MADTMQTVRILEVRVHTKTLATLVLPEVFTAAPGQFLTIWLPGVEEKPFALSGAGNGRMEVTIKAIGPFTRRAMECRAGDWVGLRGPFGRGFSMVDGSLLVGGGIGNAPLRFLAQRLAESGKRFTWVAGGREAADLRDLEELGTPGQCRFFTEDGSSGQRGLVTAGLAEEAGRAPPKLICGSGPEPMLLAVREFARAGGFPVELSFERYMKCGIGLCGQCCLEGSGLRLCVEGPVLTEELMAGVTEFGLPHRFPSGRRPSRPGG